MREGMSSDIFNTMDNFFDSHGDGYHSRSIGMLSLNTENALEKLKNSFTMEPLRVRETGEGSYLISSNGYHRYTVLRTLFLKELYEANGDPAKIEAIKQKYVIPVDLTGIDLEKTYSKFILSFIGSRDPATRIVDMESYYEPGSWESTDNVLFAYERHGELKKRVLTTDEFVQVARQAIMRCPPDEPTLRYVDDAINRYPSFRKFIQDRCPEYLSRTNAKEEMGDEERV